MGSCSCDRLVSALEGAERIFTGIEETATWRYPSGDVPVRGRRLKRDFENEFGFMKLFAECIHKWSDADKVIPNLGSLTVKIHDTMEGFANQLKVAATTRPPKWLEFTVGRIRPRLFERDSFKWAGMELNTSLKSLRGEFNRFKPQIAGVYDSLSSHSFHSHFPRYNYGHLQKFVDSVESNLMVLNMEIDIIPVRKQITAFQNRLKWVLHFLGRVADKFPNMLKIQDFIIHIGSVAFYAALLLCHWWAVGLDKNMAEDVTLTLFYLEQKIGFTNPEFLDLYLSLLQYLQDIGQKTSVNPVNLFVEDLLNFPQSNIRDRLDLAIPCTLHGELMSLIKYAANMPEYTDNMRRFLVDIKVVGKDVAFLEYKMHRACEDRICPEGRIRVLNLLPKIWLIKIEIFLMKQLTAGDVLQLSAMKQINAVKRAVEYEHLTKCLMSVIRHIDDAPEGRAKNVKQMLDIINEVPRIVESVYSSNDGEEIRSVLLGLLVEIALFKLESLLMELCENNGTLLVSAKDLIQPLYERLKFLIWFVKNQPGGNMEIRNLVFTRTAEIACCVISLCYLFYPSYVTTDINEDMMLSSSNLRDKIRIIILELKKIYLSIPPSNFPRTNGLGFIDYLLGKLRELLNNKADSVVSVKHHIEEISKYLEFFRPFLGDIVKLRIEVAEFKDLSERAINVAYEAEYLIDSIVGQKEPEWYNLLWLFHFLEDIGLIKMQVETVHEKIAHDVGLLNVVQKNLTVQPSHHSGNMILQAVTPRIDEAVLSLNDQEELIIDRLIGGTLQRTVVAIVGMPGIGKTTLAKTVYGSPSVFNHFHIRAWCCVSQAYTKRELLLGIFSYITSLTDDILELTDEDLEFKLYQQLKKRRYLIVMDDIWNTTAWHELKRSLPDDGNGSRILFTSRLKNVALEAQPDCNPHSLRLLSDAESWHLLQIKIFDEEVCPEELMEVGEKIAKHCRGLPLGVVAVAGLLKGSERQLVWWKEIAESLSSRIVDDPQMHCMDILELSYMHLPDHLKSCFLYFGTFLEDEDIPVPKLTQLWTAEGFIPRMESKSIEDLAEEYLMDLIGRSLVMVARRKSCGGVKTCRVHDMLRNLCLSKAKEENFLKQLTVSDAASLDGLDYGDFRYVIPSNSITFQDHRLSIYSKRRYFVMSQPSGPRVRSLLFFASSDRYPRCPYDISFISENFKFLKILNLECINMGVSFCKGITSLVHLSYLAVTGDIDSVPSSISNLWNLETFHVKGLKGMVEMPDTVWHMSRLRHLHVKNHVFFRLPDDNFEHFPQLDNLVSLSSLHFWYGEDADKMTRRLPNVRKFKCIFLESLDYHGNWNSFPRLNFPTQLESLKIIYHRRTSNPVEFNYPLNLKKLTLSNFCLPWDHISPIGRLQNLEVLKLISRAFEGERWDMTEGEFTKLKFLKLDTLNFVQWNVSSCDLPNLQHLVLRSCKHLEEVPSSLAEIPTLQRIEVLYCGQSCEDSVRSMEGQVEGLEILVNLSYSDARSLS